jgi:N-methylhydantoinase B
MPPISPFQLLQSRGRRGYGDALSRPPEDVFADVREDFVSADAAARDYGVVLTADGGAVDEAATESRRAMAGRRPRA